MRRTMRGTLFLAFLVWLGFALVAVGGGVLRVVWLQPRLGELPANVAETLALVVVLLLLIRLATPWLVPTLERRPLVLLGGFWLGLTLAFEFLFGHYIDGAAWSALLANYDFTAGRLWILVPVTMAIEPWLIGRLGRKEVHAYS